MIAKVHNRSCPVRLAGMADRMDLRWQAADAMNRAQAEKPRYLGKLNGQATVLARYGTPLTRASRTAALPSKRIPPSGTEIGYGVSRLRVRRMLECAGLDQLDAGLTHLITRFVDIAQIEVNAPATVCDDVGFEP